MSGAFGTMWRRLGEVLSLSLSRILAVTNATTRVSVQLSYNSAQKVDQ